MSFITFILICGFILPTIRGDCTDSCCTCLGDCSKRIKSGVDCASSCNNIAGTGCVNIINGRQLNACYANDRYCQHSPGFDPSCENIPECDVCAPWEVVVQGCETSATFYFQCDDQFNAIVSRDGGASWGEQKTGSNWEQLGELRVTGINSQTMVDIWCEDNGHYAGFIGTMSYSDGREYSTTNPLSNSVWEIMGTTSSPPTPPLHLEAVSASSLVYTPKNSGVWGNRVHSQIKSDANWVWNGQLNNVLYFRVNLGKIFFGNAKVAAPNNEPAPDFIRFAIDNIGIIQVLATLIGVLVLANILCFCYGKYGKHVEYRRVKYEDTDSESI